MITCKNDRLLELLWFVGYCIEFPTQLAVRIGGGAEWNRRVMYRAIREGYVRLYSILSIIVADKLLLADINEEQMHSIANELNLVSVTGWHSVFLADDSMIYMYRQCLWLSMSLTYEDLLTILKECISEYKRGKGRLTTGEYPTDPVA